MASIKKKPWYFYLKWLLLWPTLLLQLPGYAMRRLDSRPDITNEKKAWMMLVLDVIICIGCLAIYALFAALVAIWITKL